MKRLVFVLAMSLCFLGCDKAPADSGAADPAAEADKAHGHDHAREKGHEKGHGAACACSEGKKGATVWCDACGSGYIKGEKTKDKAAVATALAAAKPAEAAKPAAESK